MGEQNKIISDLAWAVIKRRLDIEKADWEKYFSQDGRSLSLEFHLSRTNPDYFGPADVLVSAVDMDKVFEGDAEPFVKEEMFEDFLDSLDALHDLEFAQHPDMRFAG